jgi:hypothetical protein
LKKISCDPAEFQAGSFDLKDGIPGLFRLQYHGYEWTPIEPEKQLPQTVVLFKGDRPSGGAYPGQIGWKGKNISRKLETVNRKPIANWIAT